MRENLVELALAMAVELDRLARDPQLSEIHIDTTLPRRYRAELMRRIEQTRAEEQQYARKAVCGGNFVTYLTDFRA